MNILLDTHAFLWFVDDNPRLSNPARVLIESDIEKMTLVSADPAFDAYEIKRVW